MTVFWGMCLVLFDLNLSLGSVRFDILPDLIGWPLIADGVSRILSFSWTEEADAEAKKLTWLVRVMIGFSALSMVLNLFGISNGFFYLIFAILSEVLGLYTTYFFCSTFCLLEKGCEKSWNGDKLMQNFWKFLVCYVVGTILMYLLAILDSYFVLAVAVLALLAGTFLFLFELYHACRWWTDDPYPNKNENEEIT